MDPFDLGQISQKKSREVGLTLKLSNGVIANSQAGLDAWNLRPPRGKVIHNGFDLERLKLFKPDKEKPKFTVIMVGRMVPEKDYPTFFLAAREVLKECEKPVHFMAIGVGVVRERWITENQDLIDSGVLEFPDAGLEVIPYLNAAAVGVLMSNAFVQEGISNAIMEYMACELPVVCSDSGGNRELVLDNVTGFIISPQDVSRLKTEDSLLAKSSGSCPGNGKIGKGATINGILVRKNGAVDNSVLRPDR